jgi:hypothetical protein
MHTARARVEFCGESYPVGPHGLTIGRDADVVLDDNAYLHRRLLEVRLHEELVWLANLGTRISVTVADDAGLAQTLLAPGARVPLVFPRTVAWFTAGPSTYDIEIVVDDPPFAPVPDLGSAPASSSRPTIGQVRLTPEQHLLILGLAEPILRRGRGVGSIPASQEAADRLGWTITKFNRKLDNVCERLTAAGVRGLLGTSDRLASNRRVRLVEYALASRLVTPDDLPLLDLPAGALTGPTRSPDGE